MVKYRYMLLFVTLDARRPGQLSVPVRVKARVSTNPR